MNKIKLFGLFVLVTFFWLISLFWLKLTVSSVYADALCGDGMYCFGSIVFDEKNGCKTTTRPDGSYYCTQSYNPDSIERDCYSNCTYSMGSYETCCNTSNCSTYGCVVGHSGSCCARETTYCGDGSCNGSENCGSCPSDCGACCTPSCSPACGQANGCGGTCGTGDAGTPGTPALSPADGGAVSVTEGEQVTVSWSSAALADLYELELYPAGSDCADIAAHCLSQAGTTYSFDPLYPVYYYQVTALNNSCSASEYGTAGSAVFTVNGIVSGQVKADNNDQAVLVGGVCVLGGALGVQPGLGSTVTVNTDSGAVDGSGNYSVATGVGSGLAGVLVVGDPASYRCTCPLDCVYSTSSPKTGLDFFVSNYRPAWWQVEDGDVHSNGGNVSSNIPALLTTSCMIGSGNLAIFSASLARQSKLLTWSARITPLMGNPSGRATSNG